jgi:aminoglycoside phosphotransferase (APT) family kinase protein
MTQNTPYLSIIRHELATTLYDEADENKKRSSRYSQRILSALIAEQEALPAIHHLALTQLEEILDDTCKVLSGIPGGSLLTAELIHHIRFRPDYRNAEPFLQDAIALMMNHPASESQALVLALSDIVCEIHDAFYQATTRTDTAQADVESQDVGLTTAQLSSLVNYLRSRFPGESDLKIVDTKTIIGGGSKLTVILTFENHQHLPPTLVLRKDNADYGSVVGSTVADEYLLAELMFEAKVPGPRPYGLETDTAILGAPFILVSRIDGKNIGDWIQVYEPSRDFAIELASAMAKMHAVPLDKIGNKLPGWNISVRQKIEQDILELEKTWRTLRQPSIGMEQACQWLKAHLDFAEGQRGLVHCDAGLHNMLCHDGHLTAILDWETAIIGNPAQDLAYIRPTISQMVSWEEFLAEYVRAGGTAPSQEELDFFELWRCAFQIHWLYIARSYVQSGLSRTLVHAYGAQRLYHYLDRDLHLRARDIIKRYSSTT